MFGSKYEQAVHDVKMKDNQLSALKTQRPKRGLMTAQLGSVYDVPSQQAESTNEMAST